MQNCAACTLVSTLARLRRRREPPPPRNEARERVSRPLGERHPELAVLCTLECQRLLKLCGSRDECGCLLCLAFVA